MSETPFDEKYKMIYHIYNWFRKSQNIPNVSYDFKDGRTIEVGVERFLIPERIFRPELSQLSIKPLHLMAYESITKTDSDIRKDLCSTIILTGGNTLFSGLPKRFESELSAKIPVSFVLK